MIYDEKIPSLIFSLLCFLYSLVLKNSLMILRGMHHPRGPAADSMLRTLLILWVRSNWLILIRIRAKEEKGFLS